MLVALFVELIIRDIIFCYLRVDKSERGQIFRFLGHAQLICLKGIVQSGIFVNKDRAVISDMIKEGPGLGIHLAYIFVKEIYLTLIVYR